MDVCPLRPGSWHATFVIIVHTCWCHRHQNPNHQVGLPGAEIINNAFTHLCSLSMSKCEYLNHKVY